MNSYFQNLNSRRLTTVDVNTDAIRTDLATVDQLVGRDTYSEFSFGRWHSHVLANATGDENDDEFRPQTGPTVVTPLGKLLPAIMELVEGTFYLDQLRWIRILTQTDGLLMPHIDFIEFNKSTTRLQLPLRTTPSCLHSEEHNVIHMRPGEVWFLDASRVHAAYSPPGPSRVALCLDFDIRREQIMACLRQSTESAQPPALVDRPPLEQKQLNSLIDLGSILDLSTLRDILRLFGIVHFRRQVHAAACFDWLVAAAERSANAQLVQQARDYRTYCLYKRTYGKHFTWLRRIS
jgi:putative nonproteinogenic amino acid hydroxylase